ERGDGVSFDFHLLACQRSVEAAPHAHGGYQLLQLRAARAAMVGRFREAFALLDEAEAAFERMREPFGVARAPAGPFLMQHLAFERGGGHRAAIEELLERPWGPLESFVCADLLMRLGRPDEARTAFERAASLGISERLHFFGREFLAEACAALRDQERAAQL